MATTKWNLDPSHSEIQFKVRHMMISNVTGHFEKFDATVETEGDDFSTAKVHFTADVNSITTKNDQRDTHLKSADFFDAESHGQITFEGTRLEKVNDEQFKLHGTLTIRGTSKPVSRRPSGPKSRASRNAPKRWPETRSISAPWTSWLMP